MITSEGQPHILIVEDESVVAMDIGATLEKEGYHIVGIAGNGRKAFDLFNQHKIDLLLCDIGLKGDWDGIDTVQILTAKRPVPVIYLTASTDQATLARAKNTYPSAFINKPFQQTSLCTAIALAIHNFASRNVPKAIDATQQPTSIHDGLSRDSLLQIGQCLFIKENYQFVKVSLDELLYLEADNVHTTLVTTGRKYVLRLTLGNLLERVRYPGLVRIHRSYAVNLHKIDSFNDVEVRLGPRLFPLSRIFKDAFLNQFQFR